MEWGVEIESRWLGLGSWQVGAVGGGGEGGGGGVATVADEIAEMGNRVA